MSHPAITSPQIRHLEKKTTILRGRLMSMDVITPVTIPDPRPYKATTVYLDGRNYSIRWVKKYGTPELRKQIRAAAQEQGHEISNR